MKPGQLGNKMKCQHFTIFFVFMIRVLKFWNFQRQLIFFHAVICILVITRNILHAIPWLLLCFPQRLTFRKNSSLVWVMTLSSHQQKIDAIQISCYHYHCSSTGGFYKMRHHSAICFLARGASFLVEIFYINLDPTGGPQLLCEFFLH